MFFFYDSNIYFPLKRFVLFIYQFLFSLFHIRIILTNMITMFAGRKVIKTMTVGMAFSSVFILFFGSMEALDDFPISSCRLY